MIEQILACWKASAYDFRRTANPDDPLRHLFAEWVEYYRLKWSIAKVLQPRSILEIGVRYGYSAMAFMSASPGARYTGIDHDTDTFGGCQGALDWARQAMRAFPAEFISADTQQMTRFPGGPYDLVHVDGQQDGDGTFHDLKLAIAQARYILLDGYFWSGDNMQASAAFVQTFRDLIEYAGVLPGYAGELLIKVRPLAQPERAPSPASNDIRRMYDSQYYLCDCGGYDSYKRTSGKSLEDGRLRAVATLAQLAQPARVLDLGCGRGELVHYFAAEGARVVGVDYSESAIALAERCFEDEPKLRERVELVCGDVCTAPLSGFFDAVTASDVVEHLGDEELDRLYARVAAVLAPLGVFVIHTFPNLWYYKYDYPRKRRLARQLGAYLPPEPRTRYELEMHINEQSPRRMLRQLASHFPHVLLWFGEPEDVLGNLGSPPRKEFVRSAKSLFAIAAHRPVRPEEVIRLFRMPALGPLPADAVRIRFLGDPLRVAARDDFQVQVELENRSSVYLQSKPPFPVNLSYHWLDEERSIRVFDGARTRLAPELAPGSRRQYSMRITPPGTPGAWTLRVTLVQEGVRWFDEPPTSLRAEMTCVFDS